MGITMKSFMLLVTWFVYGQPPNSYQIAFSSIEVCEAARTVLLKEPERLTDEISRRRTTPTASPSFLIETKDFPARSPIVSAVCVETQSKRTRRSR